MAIGSRQATVYDRIMNELLALFTRSSKLARAAADEAMSRHGVRVGQNLLLEVLWETDGLTPGELASRLNVATPTVVKSANRMATAGLLVRKPEPADARLVRLYLTDRARSVRRAIERERDETGAAHDRHADQRRARASAQCPDQDHRPAGRARARMSSGRGEVRTGMSVSGDGWSDPGPRARPQRGAGQRRRGPARLRRRSRGRAGMPRAAPGGEQG